MEDQLEEFRQDQLEKYLDETSTEDISADDLYTWFQNNQPNASHGSLPKGKKQSPRVGPPLRVRASTAESTGTGSSVPHRHESTSGGRLGNVYA